MSTKETNPKDAIGSTKPPLSTLSAMVTHEVALGLLEGSCKYRRHNYRVYGVRASIYYDATMRHINKWWEGEDIDPDSGLSHVIKAICSLYVLRDAMIQDMLQDDRPPIGRPEFWAELEAKTKEVLARYPNPKLPHTQIEESENEKHKKLDKIYESCLPIENAESTMTEISEKLHKRRLEHFEKYYGGEHSF